MQNCRWLVNAPQDHIVGYKVSDFDLGPGDSVQLRDGKDKDATLIRSLSRTSKSWLVTNGPSLWLKFSSETNFMFKGFELRIKFFKNPTGNYIVFELIAN